MAHPSHARQKIADPLSSLRIKGTETCPALEPPDVPNPLGPLYTIEFVVCLVCAVAWYKAADAEDVPPWHWVGLSVGTYALTWLWLRWGWLGNRFGQLVLLVGVTLFRAWRSHVHRDQGGGPS